MDLSMFSSSESLNESDSDMTGRENRKMRKMTHDFTIYAQRSKNPIEKDPMFKKMNQEGVISEIDLDNLI